MNLAPTVAASRGAQGALVTARQVSCQVSLPASWTSTIAKNQTALVTRPGLAASPYGPVPFAVTATGVSYFADFASANWAGIVEVTRATGAMQQIYQFPSRSAEVYQGAFDGRWLVWTLSDTTLDPDPATLMAWDATSGQVSTLVPYAGSSSDIDFALATSGDPARDGLVAWTIVPDLVAGGGFSVEDLASGRTESIHTGGAANTGTFLGDRYVYDSGTSHLAYHALATPSWRPTNLPAGLRRALQRSLVDRALAAVSSRGVAWTAENGPVTWWPSAARGPEQLAVNGGEVMSFLQIGSVVLWGVYGTGDMYVADTRTLSYARLPMRWGSGFATNQELLLLWSPRPNEKADPVATSSFIDPASLPRLPSCHP